MSSSLQITASEPHEINIIALTNLVTNTIKFLSHKESANIHIAAQMFDACKLLEK